MNETVIHHSNGTFEVASGGASIQDWAKAVRQSAPTPVDSLISPNPPAKGSTKVPAPEVLEAAVAAMQARAASRDAENGERSMARTVQLFNTYSEKNLTEAEGWAFMIFLKMVRGMQGKFNVDDYVDGAAFFALLGECESQQKQPKKVT